jgi:putative DNA primase/helicase
MSNVSNLDLDESKRFLKLIDPLAKNFTFQTFEDKKPPTNGKLAMVVQSPAQPRLLQLHAHGAGIYLTINETDGKGRKSENIIRVRAVWHEDDGGLNANFPLAPSLLVETSPGHFHRYWLVEDVWPADELGRKDFAAVMERMVESYASDKNAKDISRVLRVPGFLHRKDKPHLIRIVEASGKRYTRAQIIAAFPPLPREKQYSEWNPPRGDESERLRDALNYINPDDRDIWLEIGMALKEHLSEFGRFLWDQWSRQSSKFNQADQDKTWKGFHRHDIKIGTLYHHAKKGGWQGRQETHRARSNRSGGKDKTKKQLIVHDANAVEPEPVEWGWPGRIAVGKTTLIGGDPGLGKSQLSIFIAATFSRAGEWPCQEGRAPKRSVIMLSAEDGVADTIVPRLMAAGAEREKIKIVTAVHEDDAAGRRVFNLTQDLHMLEDLITELADVGLVIIDPVDAYIGGNVDSHKNAAVRAVLEPISEMADRLNVAILALTHFSKQIAGKAIYRFIGSIAHIGSARIAFAVVADPEDKTRILLLHAKNNLAPRQKGLAFRIEQHLVKEGVIGSCLFFEKEHVTDISADEALADENGGQMSAKEDAIEFLSTILVKGAVKIQDIEAEARNAGLLAENKQMRQSKPFRAAKAELHIISTREGFGADAVYYWSLPKEEASDSDTTEAANPMRAHLKNRAHMESEGAHEENTHVESLHSQDSSLHARPQTPCAPSFEEGAHGGQGADASCAPSQKRGAHGQKGAHGDEPPEGLLTAEDEDFIARGGFK